MPQPACTMAQAEPSGTPARAWARAGDKSGVQRSRAIGVSSSRRYHMTRYRARIYAPNFFI